MRSENGGEDWVSAEGLDSVVAVYDLLEGTDKLYAGVKGEDMGWVYESDLDGLSWTQTGELPDGDIKAVHCLLEGPEGEILAGTEMTLGPSFTKVFVTQTQGAHWEQFGGAIDLANTVYALAKTSDMIYATTGHIYGHVYKCALEEAEQPGHYRIYLPLISKSYVTP
jgi:hypothetical protein